MADFHFDFVATNLERKDADELMDLITRYVGLFDGEVAGGLAVDPFEQEAHGGQETDAPAEA